MNSGCTESKAPNIRREGLLGKWRLPKLYSLGDERAGTGFMIERDRDAVVAGKSVSTDGDLAEESSWLKYQLLCRSWAICKGLDISAGRND
jgi:hypothetical protein